MAATRRPERWTYDEFARLPSDDGNRYEVIEGELYVSPSPRPLHQLVITRLILLLEGFVRSHDIGWILPGPVDVLLGDGDYLTPDIVFVRRERRGIVSSRGMEGAPDLIIEVISESTKSRDRVLKRRRYAHFGVPEYWIVDTGEKSIEVHSPRDPSESRVVTDRLVWTPIAAGPTLEIVVADTVADF